MYKFICIAIFVYKIHISKKTMLINRKMNMEPKKSLYIVHCRLYSFEKMKEKKKKSNEIDDQNTK